MASITKHNDRWRAHVFVHGTRATKVFDKRRDAQAWAAAKERELDSVKRSKGMTLAQATAKYVATISRQKAPGAAEWEERRFAEFMAYFGEGVMLSSIGSDMISDLRDHRLESVSGSTVIRESNLFRAFFQVAVDGWKLITVNPYKGVQMPEHNPARHQVWTWQLIKRVLRSSRSGKTGEAVRAFRVALHTGLRLSEVIAGKYDPVRRVIDLERTKTGGRASVPVTRRAVKVLGQPFTLDASEASSLFSKLCKELLIDGLTFHDSRGSALTWLSRRMDVMTLSRISRHRDLRILQNVYYRETAEQISARI